MREGIEKRGEIERGTKGEIEDRRCQVLWRESNVDVYVSLTC